MEGFFEKYQQLFLENSIRSKNGECVLWARKMQKTGYGAVKYKCPVTGQWKCTTAHRLSFMVATRHLDIGDKDVSHLCHNALCIRADHLSAEPHDLNCERVKCVNRGKCQGHGEYPLCLLHLKL
ncbi:MAG: hypothetical protein KUF82_20580 [Candidatus Thiodiazotropha sp. (ex Ctena orbiculata)]|nr:hypothetical protein [Candidatus Thiodiazotropha taylori]